MSRPFSMIACKDNDLYLGLVRVITGYASDTGGLAQAI